MEERSFYAKKADITAARTDEERRLLSICNAAVIGTAKEFNRSRPGYISREDFEDAMSNAILNALTHIKDDGAGISYAGKCGLTSAIKMCEKKSRYNDKFSRMDILNSDGDWCQNSNAYNVSSEDYADYRITSQEENNSRRMKDAIIRKCYEELSASDRKLADMKNQGVPYEIIADNFNCSVGTIHKRSFDMKNRFDRLLKKNGYYDLL